MPALNLSISVPSGFEVKRAVAGVLPIERGTSLEIHSAAGSRASGDDRNHTDNQEDDSEDQGEDDAAARAFGAASRQPIAPGKRRQRDGQRQEAEESVHLPVVNAEIGDE